MRRSTRKSAGNKRNTKKIKRYQNVEEKKNNMKYKTINIIIPYFGEFPNYYQFFLNSCGYNYTINWTIITDNTLDYKYPPNVKRVSMTFEELLRLFRSKFDFNLAINSFHKLCEFKPAYGYIFDNLIEGYDYWGYGDLDLIYGDMRSFLTDDILSYDKVFTLGHLSLVRNNEVINKLFMKDIFGKKLYKEAFSNIQNYNFDEEFMGKLNINTIFREYGYSVWNQSFAADIYTKSNHFLIDIGDGMTEKRKKAFFVWNNGKIVRFIKDNINIVEKEYLYIHLQKRNMGVRVDSSNKVYKIIPNRFEPLEVDVNLIKQNFKNIKKERFNNQYFRIRYRNLKAKLKKIGTNI